MDPVWRTEALKTLSVLVAVYGLPFHLKTDEEKRQYKNIYLNVLWRLNLTAKQIDQAATIWMENPENKKFPIPAELKGCLNVTDIQLARDAISRFVEAYIKYSDPYGHSKERQEKAEAHMGNIAWEIVKRRGGWSKISQEFDPGDTNAIAAMRELALTFIRQARTGTFDIVPILPLKPQETPFVALGDILKSIPKQIDGPHSEMYQDKE